MSRGVGPMWSEGARLFAIALGGPGVYRKEIAKRLSCTVSMVSMWANGHRRPDIDQAADIETLFPSVAMRAWTERARGSQVVKTELVHDDGVVLTLDSEAAE